MGGITFSYTYFIAYDLIFNESTIRRTNSGFFFLFFFFALHKYTHNKNVNFTYLLVFVCAILPQKTLHWKYLIYYHRIIYNIIYFYIFIPYLVTYNLLIKIAFCFTFYTNKTNKSLIITCL